MVQFKIQGRGHSSWFSRLLDIVFNFNPPFILLNKGNAYFTRKKNYLIDNLVIRGWD